MWHKRIIKNFILAGLLFRIVMASHISSSRWKIDVLVPLILGTDPLFILYINDTTNMKGKSRAGCVHEVVTYTNNVTKSEQPEDIEGASLKVWIEAKRNINDRIQAVMKNEVKRISDEFNGQSVEVSFPNNNLACYKISKDRTAERQESPDDSGYKLLERLLGPYTERTEAVGGNMTEETSEVSEEQELDDFANFAHSSTTSGNSVYRIDERKRSPDPGHYRLLERTSKPGAKRMRVGDGGIPKEIIARKEESDMPILKNVADLIHLRILSGDIVFQIAGDEDANVKRSILNDIRKVVKQHVKNKHASFEIIIEPKPKHLLEKSPTPRAPETNKDVPIVAGPSSSAIGGIPSTSTHPAEEAKGSMHLLTAKIRTNIPITPEIKSYLVKEVYSNNPNLRESNLYVKVDFPKETGGGPGPWSTIWSTGMRP